MDSLTVTNYGNLRTVVKDFSKRRKDKMEKVVLILFICIIVILLYVIFEFYWLDDFNEKVAPFCIWIIAPLYIFPFTIMLACLIWKTAAINEGFEE